MDYTETWNNPLQNKRNIKFSPNEVHIIMKHSPNDMREIINSLPTKFI